MGLEINFRRRGAHPGGGEGALKKPGAKPGRRRGAIRCEHIAAMPAHNGVEGGIAGMAQRTAPDATAGKCAR